ncbi:MAG: ATP-binding protein [bacterium]
MKLGLRGRLFLVSVALILAFGSTSAVYLEFELRRWLESRMEAELFGQATAALVAVEVDQGPRTGEGRAALAERLGRATGARVTLIARDGRVLAESAPGVEPAGLDNHGDRPEVVAALARGRGVARRTSGTLGTEMLYVAVPYHDSDSGGVLRLATPVAVVDEAVERMRVLIVFASLLGLVLATVMSIFASHLLSRRLRLLLDRARAMADGHAVSEVSPGTVDEIAGLDRSLSRMDDALEEVLTTLARERDRFEAVLEGMEEGVIAVDGEKRVTLVNRAGLLLMEVDEPPIGRAFAEVVTTPRIHQALERALAGETRTVQMDLEAEERRQLLVRVTPQRAGQGAVVVLHDVTRLRRLETMRRDFVANVSHELRTPVSVIRLNAETLRDGAMNDPRNGPRFVEALLRNAERLSDLISDLLDISRIESGKYPLHTASVSVGQVVQGVVDSVEQLASEKGTTLVVDADRALEAHADAKALDQVLVNLVQNAVKYTPPGSRVEVVAQPAGERVRIEVRDDGPGIPPEHRARIFERFYRVDAGRSKHMGGTGLGLSIVKHLVAQMEGSVGVMENTPRGAVFWVELPGARRAAA